LALAVVLLGALPAPAACTCSDPCLQAGRTSRKTCVSSAFGAFQGDVEGCLEREHVCVDACRTEQQDCRSATGLGDALGTCIEQLVLDRAQCRATHPLDSRKRARCIDQAQIAAFRCRRDATRAVRGALRACRRDFRRCAFACAPGTPLAGVLACRQQAKAVRQTAVAQCQDDFVLSASACIDKAASCVDGCNQARGACVEPTEAAFAAAYAACTDTRNAAVAACQADFPDDPTARSACVESAQAAAFSCRDAAAEAAEPGLTACASAWAQCIDACPAG